MTSSTPSSNIFEDVANVTQEKLDPEIPRPVTEYTIHITIRSIQCGSFIGSILGPAAFLLSGKEKNRKNIMSSVVTGGQAGAVVGAAMGPVLTYMNLRGLCDLVLYGKCYSLRFDEDALRRDRAAVFSAAVGYLSSGSPGLILGLDFSFMFSKLVNYFV